MLVTGQTWIEDIPHERGENFTFRKLSWLELESAAKARRKRVMDEYRGMIDLMDKLPPTPATEQVVEEYDKETLLSKGIKAWSYDAPCTGENITLLDPMTAEWAYQQLVEAHRPRTEDERKNG